MTKKDFKRMKKDWDKQEPWVALFVIVATVGIFAFSSI